VCADTVAAAGQAPESGDPFQGAFNDVAVPAQPAGRLDALAGDAGDDAAPA
jgi:hypothetical protein